MPVTVACVVMTGESRERDAAVTIAGGFSGAAVPARSGISYVDGCCDACAVRLLTCAVRAERSASQARAAAAGAAEGAAMQLRQRCERLRERERVR